MIDSEGSSCRSVRQKYESETILVGRGHLYTSLVVETEKVLKVRVFLAAQNFVGRVSPF